MSACPGCSHIPCRCFTKEEQDRRWDLLRAADTRVLPWWAYVLMLPLCAAAAIWIGGWVINAIVEMGGG